ncbi:hypothetical protein P4118_24585 [Pseudomonas aeruginosa]|nr:hypothetical protein [Pseudomonas aeruginosa]
MKSSTSTRISATPFLRGRPAPGPLGEQLVVASVDQAGEAVLFGHHAQQPPAEELLALGVVLQVQGERTDQHHQAVVERIQQVGTQVLFAAEKQEYRQVQGQAQQRQAHAGPERQAEREEHREDTQGRAQLGEARHPMPLEQHVAGQHRQVDQQQAVGRDGIADLAQAGQEGRRPDHQQQADHSQAHAQQLLEQAGVQADVHHHPVGHDEQRPDQERHPDGSAPLHQRVPAEKLAKLVFQLLFEPQPTKAVAQLARIRIIRQTSLYQAVACKHADSPTSDRTLKQAWTTIPWRLCSDESKSHHPLPDNRACGVPRRYQPSAQRDAPASEWQDPWADWHCGQARRTPDCRHRHEVVPCPNRA